MIHARTSGATGRSSGFVHAVVLAASLLAACGDTTAPPGRAQSRGPAGQRADLPPTPRPPAAPVPAPGRQRPPPTPPDWEAPRGASPGAAGGAEGEESDRDPEESLRRHLQDAFGTPTACISEETRDRLDDALHVSVTARVLPSGRVLDATVSASALSEADLACMRRHAQTLRLRSGIPGTPRSISASIEYRVDDDRVTREEREPGPRNLHPGTLSPDRTLEAAGTVEDRPAGSVTPDVTLPAQAPAGPAPGYVPPGSTLPAQGE